MASRRKTRARLSDSLGKQYMVRVERAPKFADRLDGFIVAVSDEWTLMAQVSDGGYFDGFVAFRLSDVKRANRDHSFESTFAKTQPEWAASPTR